MSKRIFVDTQYVVALVNQRDQFHSRACELADRFSNQLLLTTDAVLIEIGNALSRNFRTEAVEVIDRFLTSSDVKIVRTTPELFAEAFDLFRAHRDKAWGMTDCISFVAMRQTGADEVLTHDHHFTQAGFVALLQN